MTINFCTLFDKGFLARGVALHESLMQECPDFVLWMMCMDDLSYTMLQKLNLKNVKLLRVSEVEDERVLAVKSDRKTNEYCWMFSSVLPLYLLEKNPSMETITYIDADMYFYAPVDEIYREFGNNSIMIIPHAFSEKQKHREKTSGKYNVGMMIFRNDEYGLECLRWWKDRVIEWCYDRYEDGKLGDQLYLDDWTERFKKVFVLTHPGADVASWNTDRFTFRVKKAGEKAGAVKNDSKKIEVEGTEKINGKKFPLIFYHFHGLKIYTTTNGKIRPYPVSVYDRTVYKLYIPALQRAYNKIRALDPAWSYGTVKKLDILRVIKQNIVLWATK